MKICDFGSAKVLSPSGLNTPYIVSRYYRAPELILACSDYTNAIDVWAIGCILAEFLTRRPIFPGKTEGSQLIEQIAILGLPTADELKAMSPQMSPHTIEQVHKLDNIQRRDFKAIIRQAEYLVSLNSFSCNSLLKKHKSLEKSTRAHLYLDEVVYLPFSRCYMGLS